jgi:hypothetical protein
MDHWERYSNEYTSLIRLARMIEIIHCGAIMKKMEVPAGNRNLPLVRT